MIVLITGSRGFLGGNLQTYLEAERGITVLHHNRGQTSSELSEKVQKSSIIYHFAGVNRTQNPDDFQAVNVGLTEEICHFSAESALAGYKPKTIVYSSSRQATLDNEYGVSKLEAERVLSKYTLDGMIGSVVFRLPGIFGPGARPNYNSVVANFCDAIAHGIQPTIFDASRKLRLVYIDDVVKSMSLVTALEPGIQQYLSVAPEFEITVEELYELLLSLRPETSLGRLPNQEEGALKMRLAQTLLHSLK
jgi:UDP-2-acetamido-2,6-beta-L-arabino-hexul-4-ose reductase